MVFCILISLPSTFASESTEPEFIDNSNFVIGEVQWGKEAYSFSEKPIVKVIDSDMNKNPNQIESFEIDIWSDSDAGGIDLVLLETGINTGIFEAGLFFTDTDESDNFLKELRVAEGDTLTAEYEDQTLPPPFVVGNELDITDTAFIGSTISNFEHVSESIVLEPLVYQELETTPFGLYTLEFDYASGEISTGIVIKWNEETIKEFFVNDSDDLELDVIAAGTKSTLQFHDASNPDMLSSVITNVKLKYHKQLSQEELKSELPINPHKQFVYIGSDGAYKIQFSQMLRPGFEPTQVAIYLDGSKIGDFVPSSSEQIISIEFNALKENYELMISESDDSDILYSIVDNVIVSFVRELAKSEISDLDPTDNSSFVMGEITLDKNNYQLSDTLIVQVNDFDMNANPNIKESFTVDVWSDSDKGGIDLLVSETSSNSGIFEGAFTLIISGESTGTLVRATNDDVVTVNYNDITLPPPNHPNDKLGIKDTTVIGNIESFFEPEPILESIPKPTSNSKKILDFVDKSKDPQYYLDRYNNEPNYKEWFDENYPDYTIEEAIGLSHKSELPEWVRNIFIWYAEERISEQELLGSIQFLIDQEILKPHS